MMKLLHLTKLGAEELIANGITSGLARTVSEPDLVAEHLWVHFDRVIDWEFAVPQDVDDVVPIWGCNGDVFVRWARNDVHEYVKLYHDDDKFLVVARSEQGLMALLLANYFEQREGSDEEAAARTRVVSEAIRFEHFDAAVRMLTSGQDALPDDYDEWRRCL